jgi:hypothetical protein
MNTRRIFLVIALGLLASAVIMPGLFGSAAEAVRQDWIDAPRSGGVRPPEKDVRGGAHGVPKSPVARALSATQSERLKALQVEAGNIPLVVQYNALTNTPRHLFSHAGYLSAPDGGDAENIARGFIKRWQGIFRFTDADLASMQLKSSSLIPDMGTSVLVFEQHVKGVPVFKGEVLVNINREGRVLSVGSDSFPQLKVTNSVAISPAAAIDYAARDMGLGGYSGQSLGDTQVRVSYGKSAPRHITGQKFTGGNLFTDDIVVTPTIFPLGAEARHAYKFTLTTPQFSGIMWENVVDAQTGEVLHRFSLTMFQGSTKKGALKGKAASRGPQVSFGPPGGGPVESRRGTYSPNVQDFVESFNGPGTATALVFDAAPTALGGRRCTQTAVPTSPTFDSNCGGATTAQAKAYGRPSARGQRPGYRPDVTDPATVPRNSGRGFQEGMVRARVENPFSIAGGALFSLVYDTPFAQVQRGMPDALNPSPGSPFGWYYLPTGTGGTEITTDDTNRAATKNYGYNMTQEARLRNVPENAPEPCTGTGATRECGQPFSATLTPLTSPVALPDGRTLTQVFQSNYTEGNNVLVADDRANDDATTIGIRGYDPNRQFTASRFIFTNGYEFGGVDASNQPAPGTNCPPFVVCPVNFPASADPDVYPGTLSLFYYNNIVHDYLYTLGFTEALFNMQQDNFGRGGIGRDGIDAQVQDGSGTNNANMSPQPEGSHPRMQMYLFTESSFRRADGSFDFDVVAHEQMHAINNRAVGKGDTGCVGNGLVGESGGQGEGWGDYLADSMGDDDAIGEYVTGEFDVAIRRLPVTNYRWSYQSINGNGLTRRDRSYNPAAAPDLDPGATPFETHDTGEVWSATLWDMRELMIMKDTNGVFFDGLRRLDANQNGGTGGLFYIGNRRVRSVDAQHPIEYRPQFMTTIPNADPTLPPIPNIRPTEHIVRPGLVAAEIQAAGGARTGPLATALRKGALLADTLMMRGMQLSPCNPTFVDSRNSILLADRELTGGENRAIIWRAFASHGVGMLAQSSSNGGAGGTVVEDFSVPAGVTSCEQNGPLAAPDFALTNTLPNTVTITIQPQGGAARFIISRAESANGPFVVVAEATPNPVTPTVVNDNNGGEGLILNKTYYYQVRSARDAEMNCVSTSQTKSITITVGVVNPPAPIFFGVTEVLDPKACTTLVVGWGPATSANPLADIVYDVYRAERAFDPGPTAANPTAPDNAPLEPTFEPTAANRVAQGLRNLTFIDSGLTLDRVYYYIVQARDLNANKVDTNNTGNRRAKFNAPTAPSMTSTPVFAPEDFEAPTADTRFTPPLVEAGNDPKGEVANFQRVTGVQVSTGSETAIETSMMYGPDFNPGDPDNLNCGGQGGGQSDFSTTIGPITLTRTSIMDFDHFFITEEAFDGGVMEIKVGGDATFNSTPYPDEVTTFDLGNFIVQGGYNGRLNGTLEGVARGSILQGRRAYTGAKTLLHHVRVPLEAFAPGGMHNPAGLPVRIRFRMTSDVASIPACNSGWFIDNLAINNLDATSCPTIRTPAIGDLIISEFRLRGTNGANDEFIELYNRTESPIIVSAFDGSAGFSLAAPNASGVLTTIATVPGGRIIPARGHILVANNGAGGYSLANYGGTGRATPDVTYTNDIPDNSGVALFRTSVPTQFTLANRLDAAGFSTANELYREGAGLPPIGATDGEYSHVRNLTSGFPQDTDQNANDFLMVHTGAANFNGVQSILGAPGPENSESQIQRNAVVKASAIDPGCTGNGGPQSACARVRTGQGAGPNAAFGTLLLRRKFTNKSNDFIRQLRFRVVNITTLGNRVNNEADLRVLSSSDITVTDSNNGDIALEGLTLEENPPAQPNGGGLNSTLRARLGRQLAPNSTINVEFRLGVMVDGQFRFLVNVEALP